jgi:hypothetical protein
MAYAKKRRSGEAERITIVIVIILAMLSVAVAIAIHLFDTPERNVKSKVDTMVSEYYENYFYKKLIKNGTTDSTLARTMEKFRETGFSPVYFRQLLLYDNGKNSDLAPLVTKYCDENQSYVQIYPDPPYGSTNYHTKYYYSCEF